jgi:hypothetical protein
MSTNQKYKTMRKHYFLFLPVLIACFSMQVSAQVNLQQGLVAYYPFNGNANDESGNGFHGTLYGNAYISNNQLVIGDNDIDHLSLKYHVIHGLTDFSFTFFTKINVLHSTGMWPNQTFVSGARANMANAFTIFYRSGNDLSIKLDHVNSRITTVILDDLEWHHVAVVRSNDLVYVYFDGVLYGTASIAATPINIAPNGFVIGQEQDAVGGGFAQNQSLAGYFDEFRVYNRAINAQEVAAIFNNGQPTPNNTISNILINQRNNGSGMVDVYFNLNGTGSQYTINLAASFDGGNTYTAIPASFLSGDVSNISPGINKHIVWDGLGSHPNTYSTATKLKIIAN